MEHQWQLVVEVEAICIESMMTELHVVRIQEKLPSARSSSNHRFYPLNRAGQRGLDTSDFARRVIWRSKNLHSHQQLQDTLNFSNMANDKRKIGRSIEKHN
jgi:hypothetical protein